MALIITLLGLGKNWTTTAGIENRFISLKHYIGQQEPAQQEAHAYTTAYPRQAFQEQLQAKKTQKSCVWAQPGLLLPKGGMEAGPRGGSSPCASLMRGPEGATALPSWRPHLAPQRSRQPPRALTAHNGRHFKRARVPRPSALWLTLTGQRLLSITPAPTSAGCWLAEPGQGEGKLWRRCQLCLAAVLWGADRRRSRPEGVPLG